MSATFSTTWNVRDNPALDHYLGQAGDDGSGYQEALALETRIVEPREPQFTGVTDLLRVRCTRPLAPAVPDGTTASREQMLVAQTRVREYVDIGEVFLGCINGLIDDPASGLTAAQRDRLVREHNVMVGRMRAVADAYNRAREQFLARD